MIVLVKLKGEIVKRYKTKKARTDLELAAAWSVWRLCFPSDDMQSAKHVWLTWDKEQGCYCAMSSFVFMPESDAVFFNWVGVLPYVRRQGLHLEHIKRREAWARKLGAQQVVTYTLNHVTQSARNLQARGFDSYTPGYKWAGDDANYWQRWIT